jgi:cyclopropane fatty-acyl-phospholipid synthase-like methyltransferase
MTSSWDDSYTADAPPPWDIGRPQPVIARLAEAGVFTARQVLDSGCGTGENIMLAASHGAAAVGVDISGAAIDLARAKSTARGLDVRFEVGDVLDLGHLDLDAEVIIDSGVFHVFSDEDRSRYVTSLAKALRTGGTLYLMCFSDRQPGDWGPRRVRQDELRASFTDGWAIQSISPETFEVRPMGGATLAQAWLAVIRRR